MLVMGVILFAVAVALLWVTVRPGGLRAWLVTVWLVGATAYFLASLVTALGTPRPIAWNWDLPKEGKVLWIDGNPEVGIFLLIDFPDREEPFLLSIPWNEKAAGELTRDFSMIVNQGGIPSINMDKFDGIEAEEQNFQGFIHGSPPVQLAPKEQ